MTLLTTANSIAMCMLEKWTKVTHTQIIRTEVVGFMFPGGSSGHSMSSKAVFVTLKQRVSSYKPKCLPCTDIFQF